MPGSRQAATGPVYQLKVTLVGSRPPIWRRIQVPADMTLGRLHRVLQVVMGWTDSHLQQFTADGESYSDPDFELEDSQNENRIRLNRLLRRPKDRLVDEYDFGDDWEHAIVLEKVLPADAAPTHAVCLAGKRAGPPEDVGGIVSYQESFLAAVRDPEHPEHDEMLDWIGEGFDPEAFDLDDINRELRRPR
ncbi:MAG: plasmid pRiA4b ORF-3 family protein [Gemmatimonadetes bacterium]|nr:plasmid pRiA4b ORF-3 family protein [Gemmatimonadota bacterium]